MSASGVDYGNREAVILRTDVGGRRRQERRAMEDKRETYDKAIGVIGACGKSGTTHVASALAIAMAQRNERTAYLETHVCRCFKCSRRPLLFYELGLHNRIFTGRFSDFFFMKFMGENTLNRVNLYKGVNWAVTKPDSPECLLLPEDIAGRYVIWDDPPLFAASDIPLSAGGSRASLREEEYEIREEIADKLNLILCVARTETAYAAAGAGIVRQCFKRWPSKTKLIYNMISSKAALKAAERYIGYSGDFFIHKDSDDNKGSIMEIADYLIELY